ncbi:MAG TPA: hypothetical protein VF240_20170 [Pyrinomonadaceae bacterium]
MSDLLRAIRDLEKFTGHSLTRRIETLESALSGTDADAHAAILANESISRELLAGAYLLKRKAGQINVVIHALGILLLIPHIIEPGERIKYLSLGAGNTGKPFDLETTHRVAEFTFINWRGRADTGRQNKLFKDFFLLAEHPTPKRKYLYVLGTEHPLRFLTSRRSPESVMSRNNPLWADFQSQYNDRFSTVGQYFAHRHQAVTIEDVGKYLPELFMSEDITSTDDEGAL